MVAKTHRDLPPPPNPGAPSQGPGGAAAATREPLRGPPPLWQVLAVVLAAAVAVFFMFRPIPLEPADRQALVIGVLIAGVFQLVLGGCGVALRHRADTGTRGVGERPGLSAAAAERPGSLRPEAPAEALDPAWRPFAGWLAAVVLLLLLFVSWPSCVALASPWLLGLPLCWLLGGRQPLSTSAWIQAPFLGLSAAIVVLQNLVYFDVPVAQATPWVWGAAAVLWLWFLARRQLAASLTKCPAPLLAGAFLVYLVQGFGLLTIGARHYAGAVGYDGFTDRCAKAVKFTRR